MTLDILVVLWRELDDLRHFKICLDRQTVQNFKVHVALNDPTDEIKRVISHEFKDWQFYEGPNTGYAGGLQRIWSHSQAQWLLCANTDIEMPDDTLEKLLTVASHCDESVGTVMPKIYYPDGRLQSAAGLLLGPEGLCRPRGIGEQDLGQYDYLKEAPLVSGCCFLIKQALLEDIQGFDTEFFMYAEDVDVSLRALWAGWKGVSCPEIRIVHRHGGASERYGKLQLYHLERNHWWLAPLLPWSMRWKLPYYNLKRWFYLVFSNQNKWDIPQGSVLLALKATYYGVKGMLLAKRRQTPKRISSDQFIESLRGHRISFEEFMSRQ